MLEPEKVKTVTLATITLHNWLQEDSENGKIYIPKGLIDHKNIETSEIFQGSSTADDVQGHGIQCHFHVVEITLLTMLEN